MTARRSRPGKNRRNQTSRHRNQNPNLSVAVRAREKYARRRRRVRIERQQGMTLAAMLADLPRACDVGAKRNAKGFTETWIGYRRHGSATGSPAWCPFSTPMICSSVRPDFFLIFRLVQETDSAQIGDDAGGKVTPPLPHGQGCLIMPNMSIFSQYCARHSAGAAPPCRDA